MHFDLAFYMPSKHATTENECLLVIKWEEFLLIVTIGIRMIPNPNMKLLHMDFYTQLFTLLYN